MNRGRRVSLRGAGVPLNLLLEPERTRAEAREQMRSDTSELTQTQRVTAARPARGSWPLDDLR